MGVRVVDMPGPTVPVVGVEVAPREQGVAPFGYGLAAGDWRITEIHVAAEPWREEGWVPGPEEGTEVVGQPPNVGLCRRVLGSPAPPPRPELLESTCRDCVRQAAEIGVILPG